MGTKDVNHLIGDKTRQQQFTRNLLRDIKALGRMLDEGWFEIDRVRIGAEQEMCLVDELSKPNPISLEILQELDDELLTTELARFNLEANLPPLDFEGSCLREMEAAIHRQLEPVFNAMKERSGDIILTGILPTIRKYDIQIENVTPLARYKALCEAIMMLRGGEYEIRLEGMDELKMMFDTPLLEACATGFQVHLQVAPAEMVDKYNAAQAIAAPILAAATNSPILFGKRLWHETRVALFQQSIDTRKAGDHLRDFSPRVTFGTKWVENSILEVYHEDISRYRVLLSTETKEDVEQMMSEGKVPKLNALQIHNSTVYRWNRPCYGLSEGKAHLRIENRVLPSGPTVIDEIANAAFWLGLLNGFNDHVPDVRKRMSFESARSNFLMACKYGIESKFTWLDEHTVTAKELVMEELLPIARHGLKKQHINESDIDRYLNIIQERVESQQTGSRWMMKSYNKLLKDGCTREEATAALTASMIYHQDTSQPVHTWRLAGLEDLSNWKPSRLMVEEFMSTDLFTVHTNDLLDYAMRIMDWQDKRYVCVENEEKELEGLITSRNLLHYLQQQDHKHKENPNTHHEGLVEEVMLPLNKVITIQPDASITDAIKLMQHKRVGCLPVVKANKLVGIITEKHFVSISARLLNMQLNGNKE